MFNKSNYKFSFQGSTEITGCTTEKIISNNESIKKSQESQNSDEDFVMSNIQKSKQAGNTRELNQWAVLAKMMDWSIWVQQTNNYFINIKN